jgi:hypothetical protein
VEPFAVVARVVFAPNHVVVVWRDARFAAKWFEAICVFDFRFAQVNFVFWQDGRPTFPWKRCWPLYLETGAVVSDRPFYNERQAGHDADCTVVKADNARGLKDAEIEGVCQRRHGRQGLAALNGCFAHVDDALHREIQHGVFVGFEARVPRFAVCTYLHLTKKKGRKRHFFSSKFF